MEITTFLVSLIFPALVIIGLNAIFGVTAIDMAKKRGLNPVPAFFAAFFGSFVALFFIAAIPVKPQSEAEESK
jgi:hypothetical protein